MNVGIVIQARKGSSRLPGKVVESFYNDQSILEIIIYRILKTYDAKKVVLATTTNSIDNEVEQIGQKVGVNVFRGSENNVLNRFTSVVKEYEFDGVIRVCADNPFLDVKSFSDLINWGTKPNVDYVGFSATDARPTIKTHFGLWAEYVSSNALLKAEELTTERFYQEHVTNFIYGNPQLFKIDLHELPNNWAKEKNIRFTLDTKEDFELLKELYQDCILQNIEFTPANLISYVKSQPLIEEKMAEQVIRWDK